MNRFIDLWEANLKLDEANNKPGVLGTLKGSFFAPDEVSRNKRLYPSQAWNNVIQSESYGFKMDNGTMLGTVGHEDIDTDTMIREKKVAIRTNLLKEGGYGEADILDTPVGRVLHTLYKSGSTFFVSSKATGEYSGTRDDGVKIVDESKFELERFDIVADPGFLKAQPQLKEQLMEALGIKNEEEEILIKENKKYKGVSDMSNELVERLTKENIGIKDKNDSLIAKITELEKQIDLLASFKETNVDLKREVSELKEKIEGYNKFFDDVGDQKGIIEMLDKAKQMAEFFASRGNQETIASIIDEHKSYVELGSIDEISSMIDVVEKFLHLGESSDIEGAYNTIKETLEEAYEQLKEYKEKEEEFKLEDMTSKYSVTEDKIKSMREKLTWEEIEGILSDLSESNKVEGKKEGTDKPVFTESYGTDRLSRLSKMVTSK